jgi:hypothetical protein
MRRKRVLSLLQRKRRNEYDWSLNSYIYSNLDINMPFVSHTISYVAEERLIKEK